MEPFLISKDDVSLSVSIGDDGIIYMGMKGNLSIDNIDLVKQWDKKCRETVEYVSSKHPDQTLVLVDMTGFSEGDGNSLEIIRKQISHNKKYVTRSAVIGATPLLKNLLRVVLKLIRRTNMKAFDDKEKAMLWLNEGV